MSINKTHLFGRLVANVELKHGAASGKAWFQASIAVNRWHKDGEKVSFFDFKMFDKRAEAFASNHEKGDKILLYGEFIQETWKDVATRANRSKVVFMADGFEFVSSSKTPTTETRRSF